MYAIRSYYEVTIQECKRDAFDVMLRIPKWADGAILSVNGKALDVTPGSFATINRKWKRGDVISLDRNNFV